MMSVQINGKQYVYCKPCDDFFSGPEDVNSILEHGMCTWCYKNRKPEDSAPAPLPVPFFPRKDFGIPRTTTTIVRGKKQLLRRGWCRHCGGKIKLYPNRFVCPRCLTKPERDKRRAENDHANQTHA